MTLRVIGAGFGRTGTDSIRVALEQLLGGRCYHMKVLVSRRDHQERWAEFARSGRREMDWRALFEDYVATVDWPAANFYAEIMDAFPEAKVLLSVRDPGSWFESFQVLVRIMSVVSKLPFVPRLREMNAIHDEIAWHEFADRRDRASCIEVFERHIEEVKANVPPERLLVYRVQDGWGPLCRFLEVDVPSSPFPHLNSRSEIRRFAASLVAREASAEALDATANVFRRLRPRK